MQVWCPWGMSHLHVTWTIMYYLFSCVTCCWNLKFLLQLYTCAVITLSGIYFVSYLMTTSKCHRIKLQLCKHFSIKNDQYVLYFSNLSLFEYFILSVFYIQWTFWHWMLLLNSLLFHLCALQFLHSPDFEQELSPSQRTIWFYYIVARLRMCRRKCNVKWKMFFVTVIWS